MSTVGIIAEYNPFHKGHAYQINKAKELTGADHVIIIMSGNYVQRGTPAILDKYTRAKHALKNGASLVIELPVCYSTASAELFAYSAISTLNKLGVVDHISFGCENDDIDSLMKIANILANEPDDYKSSLKSFLSKGEAYPVARKHALSSILDNDSMTALLETPNNILAIEYIKALIKTKSSIKPVPVKRTDNGYHSTTTDSEFASATAIRNIIKTDELTTLDNLVPENTLADYSRVKHFLDTDDLSQSLAYKLNYTDDLCKYYDISDFLANRINNLKIDFTNYNSFVNLLLTKNETHTHISRGLIHILLEITKDDILEFKENGTIFYANPLAFNVKDTSLLKSIKNNSSIELINKFGEYYKKQTGHVKKMLDINIKADNLYNYIFTANNDFSLSNDFTMLNTNKGIV